MSKQVSDITINGRTGPFVVQAETIGNFHLYKSDIPCVYLVKPINSDLVAGSFRTKATAKLVIAELEAVPANWTESEVDTIFPDRGVWQMAADVIRPHKYA